MPSTIKKNLSKYALLLILITTMLVFEVLLQGMPGNRSMFSPGILNAIIVQNSYIVILAVGMLMCILTGGNIDLSVGSIVILVSSFAGVFMAQWGIHPYIAIFMCLGVGILIGAWQAFWIAYMKIPPFIVTLAGMLYFRGLALMLLGAQGISLNHIPVFLNIFQNFLPAAWIDNPSSQTVYISTLIIGALVCLTIIAIKLISYFRRKHKGYDTGGIALEMIYPVIMCVAVMFVFNQLGRQNGIPIVLLILGIIVMIYSYFTQNTVLGRHLYAMGGNAKAARLSGINTKRVLFFAYVNNGFLAAIAALVVTARLGQANTQAGEGFELQAIAACFIGGASAYGGVGKVGGVVIGALFMGVLNVGMMQLNLGQFVQSIINGLVLLAAVAIDVLSRNRKGSVT